MQVLSAFKFSNGVEMGKELRHVVNSNPILTHSRLKA